MARRFLAPTGMTLTLLAFLLLTPPVTAQDETPQEPPAPEATTQEPAVEQTDAAPAAPEGAAVVVDAAAAETAFQANFTEWKALIKQMRQLRTDYQTADEADRQGMSDQWDTTLAQAEELLPKLIDSVLVAYQAAPNEDRVKTSFLAKILNDYVARDLYDPALKIGIILIDNGCDLPEVFRDAGVAAFAMNDYVRTAEFMEKAKALNSLTGDSASLSQQLEDYTKFWAEELEVRAKEAAADDLPRVKLTTNKGDIIVELFENEAPETVGNFISLVKSGFYDKLTFHRVITGFMAQGGCPDGDGTGGPGYTIYDENDKPGFRKHFRGVLSMAKTNAPNSGGSQFFINFRPTPHLNGVHTVFGRVIEGMDVVDQIQRRDPQEADAPAADWIVKAEVLRDRGHEYLPRKVE